MAKKTKNTGTVKWFDNKKGMGFITNEQGEDIFVHYTGILAEEGSFRKIEQDATVTYDIHEEDGRTYAVNVETV